MPDPRTENEVDVLEGYYILHDTIGRGGFAKVKKATHVLTGERVAIKILDKAHLKEDLPRVHKEIDTLKSLNHPHICKMFQVMETTNKIFIVMEYCRGGELFDYIVQRDRLTEDEARRIFRQIAAAIAYVHKSGIAHRDLKPENILLDSGNNVKLIDFGLCATLKTGLNAELETCCGSPAYAAPELIQGLKYIGTLADVWSLGVLLYALLCGSLPFDDQVLGNLYRKIKSGKYEEPRWLSEGSKNILRCMLQTEPEYRLPVDQLLNHTWCQEGKPEPLPVVSDNDAFIENSVLDRDVMRLMAAHAMVSVQGMEGKISKFDYNTHELATYIILLQRKELLGARQFRNWGINIDRPPKSLGNRVQKSLESEFLECDSGGDIQTITPTRHHSMDGGLDDTDLLTIGSPKIKKEPEPEDENKENIDNVDFIKPKKPSAKRQRAPTNMPQTPTPSKRMSPSARSAECVMTESMRTPSRYSNKSSYSPGSQVSPSPSRRKVLGSLERGLDRVRLMLTPRTNKIKRLEIKTLNTHRKGMTISCTGSTDADLVISELKAALDRAGMDCSQKGYRLVSKSKYVKFELEVVNIEELNVLGIRRKRLGGQSWQYKKIMDEVLALTETIGLSQQASQITTSLQTMV